VGCLDIRRVLSYRLHRSGCTSGNTAALRGCAIPLAAFLTAIFTVSRAGETRSIHAAALVLPDTGDLAANLFANPATHLAQIPVTDLAVQALFQGITVTIVPCSVCSVVAILGASGGAASVLWCPRSRHYRNPAAWRMAQRHGWVAIVLISAGVFLTSGEPLARKRLRGHRNCGAGADYARPARQQASGPVIAEISNAADRTAGAWLVLVR